jgi:hypothetical protein
MIDRVKLNEMIELAWWAFFATVLVIMAVRAVIDRVRAARARPAANVKTQAVIGRARRDIERAELERFKEEAGPIWRPDPNRLREMQGGTNSSESGRRTRR